jgi:hypothetical protein
MSVSDVQGSGTPYPDPFPLNALLLNPEFPITFWSFKHALKSVRSRASPGAAQSERRLSRTLDSFRARNL